MQNCRDSLFESQRMWALKFARDRNDSRTGEIARRNSLGDWHHDIAGGRLASARTIIRSHLVGHSGVYRSLVCGAVVFVALKVSTNSRYLRSRRLTSFKIGDENEYTSASTEIGERSLREEEQQRGCDW